MGRAVVATILVAAVQCGKPGLTAGSTVVDTQATHAACRLRAMRFHTHHEFGRVRFCVAHASPSTAAGQLLLTPWRSSGGRDALMILTRDGRLAWYRPQRSGVRDLKVVRYRGLSLLTYFDWHTRAYSLLDDHYRELLRIRTVGYRTDMHDFQVTGQGTAYVASYHNLNRGGEFIRDYTIQEIDLQTGKRLFQWHASDHVPLSATYAPRPGGGKAWDFFHGNAIEPPTSRDRTIIVSARNMSSVYGIDRRTGRILWIVGGKRDQFGLKHDPGAWFCGQHDARRIRGGITLFDNGHLKSCGMHEARALRLRLDLRHRRARLVDAIPSSAVAGGPFHPWGLGSARRLPGGHVLVNWGSEPRVTEFTPRRRVVFDLRLRSNTYRAVRAKWFGRPLEPPAVVARRAHGRTVVWASWNGATNVHDWLVLGGDLPGELAPIHPRFQWANLETTMHVRARPAYVAVRALNGRGRAIGQSAAVKVR